MIGETVSHYQIIEKLGSGGMGEVFLAEDMKLNRRAALKFLPPQLVSDEEFKARFTREAQAAAKLNHPNIITIFEVSEHEGRPYFAMEHVEGESLKEIIKSEDLSTDRVIDIVMQICEGLQAAHEAGIVHRDIKPSNILIDKDGRCRILDFGLAAVQAEEKLTKSGSSLGTVNYMSPEQVQGEKVDHRSDIFSLGVVLYEIITGQPPFKGEYDAAIIYSIVNDTPEPLARYKSDISEEIQRIVSKMLEKDPHLRCQNAADVISDLKRLAVIPKSKKSEKGRETKYILAATVILAIICAGVVAKLLLFGGDKTAEDRRMLAVLPFDNLGSPDDEYFADGITDEIISRLGAIKKLGVISRTSSMQYKNTEKSLRQIGEELGVDYILEGTIRWDKAGDANRVRILPQLIQVVDDTHLWVDDYERDLTQIFAVQTDIATKIAGALDITLGTTENSALQKKPTSDLKAYDYYLRGLDYYNRFHKLDNEHAIQLFIKALDLDSTYALAYAGLADAYCQRNIKFGLDNIWLDSAIVLSRRAISIDPVCEQAYKSLGLSYLGYSYKYPEDQDWARKALEAYHKAYELNPNYLNGMTGIGWTKLWIGEYEEALEWKKKAIAFNPRFAHGYWGLGQAYRALGDYSEAELSFRKALTLQPDFYFALRDLGRLYLFKKEYINTDSCFREFISSGDSYRRSFGRTYLARIPLKQGKFSKALEFLDKGISADSTEYYVGRQHTEKYLLKAFIYAEKKNYESALDDVKRAMEIRQELDSLDYYQHFYVQLLAQNSEFEKAGKVAGDFRETIKKNNPALMTNYWYALGCIEFYKGDYELAAKHFTKSRSNFRIRYMLGRSYLNANNLDDAVTVLEKALSRYSNNRVFWGFWSVKANYYLGIAYEKSGNPNEAIEQYEEFLEIWKDADPGIEEIDDAKARLARLKEGT
jgi:non-specific serine/threonine protein kinase